MRGVSAILVAAVCLLGCRQSGEPVPDPPKAIHPTDWFPAPPGFTAEPAGRDAWRFTGPGSVGEAAIFYRTSCVQLFEWEPVDESRSDDGRWTLRYRRPDARLNVQVGETDDSLEILVTLER